MTYPSKNKFNNSVACVDGILFQSQKEARRYKELKLLEESGIIQNLQLQREFELIPTQYEFYKRYGKYGKQLKEGKRCVEHSVRYVADFTYTKDGKRIVEDTKGVKTKDYIIKRKLMLFRYGIRISEV